MSGHFAEYIFGKRAYAAVHDHASTPVDPQEWLYYDGCFQVTTGSDPGHVLSFNPPQS